MHLCVFDVLAENAKTILCTIAMYGLQVAVIQNALLLRKHAHLRKRALLRQQPNDLYAIQVM